MADVSLQSILEQTRHAIDTGDTEHAVGMAQHILQFIPTLIEGHRLLGEAYLNMDQPEQAQASFQNVLRADPENIPAYYGLGLAHQRLGQPEAAIRAFEMALEIQPNLTELRTQLLRLYSETPGSAGQFRLSRSGLGRLYARGQMYSQAIDEFRAVLESEPDRDDVRVALAETLWRDGQEDEAGDWSRETIARRPELHKPALIAAYLQLAAGDPEGETLWRTAALQEPSLIAATALFDVLPPITITPPALPAFDMAAWRADQTAGVPSTGIAATAPQVAGSVVVDEDVFAATMATASPSIDETAPEPDTVETPEPWAEVIDVEATALETEDEDISDTDLLAQLLGFAEAPGDVQGAELSPVASSQPGEAEVDVDDGAPYAVAEPLPETFSFDEWSFDDEPVAPPPATSPEPRGEVRPFSLEEPETEDYGAAEPFSLGDLARAETQTSETSASQPAQDEPGVQSFSLDAWDSIPGLENNAGIQQESAGTQDNGAEHRIQPFSLDDLLNDADVPPPEEGAMTTGENTSAALDAEVDPISLRDLGLAGEEITADEDVAAADDFTTFSLRDFEAGEAESQDPAGLDQRDAEPTVSSPTGELPPWAREDTGGDQETLTEIPQWLRDQFDEAASTTTAAESPQLDNAGSAPGTTGIDVAPFSMRDIGLEDTELEEVDPGTAAGASTSPQAAAEPEPFSFADLGLDEADFNDLRLEEPIDVEQETRNDLVPFGLADLEPSAPSVATSNGIAYGYARPDAGITQNGMAAPAAGTAQNEHSEIADLGLSDDELAHFGSNPETGGRTSEPFALADLGLSDMELASFNAAGEAIPVANEGSEELPSWLMDDDALLDQDTLDETSQIEGADRGSGLDPTGHDRATTAPDSWELDEPAASSVHEAETQPFEVASIVAEEGAGQAGPPSGDDVEPELPPMPTELSRYYERLEVDPNNHPIRLALARLSEQKNDTDRAIEQYRQLIRQGVLLDSVVEDLKEMVAGDYERPVLRRLHRLLGDAYTRQNRLDEALDEYSWT